MGDFWTAEEMAAMDRVEFDVNDRGKTVSFRTPKGAEIRVKANPRPLEWQVQQGLGLDGATAKFRGIGLATGSISIRMGGEKASDMRQEYDLFCRKYLRGPSRGQPAPTFTARHPRLARYNPPVTKIHFKADPAGEWDEMTQIEMVVFEWEEDRKASPALSSSSTAGGSKDKPNAKSKTTEALEKAVKQDSTQISELSKQLGQ